MDMRYTVTIKRKLLKRISRLPQNIQQRFRTLLSTLEEAGPTGPHAWMHYSKLSDIEYHCDLGLRYVACWRYDGKTIIIEVYYVGSREDAPY